jgi:hypothetical protein
MAVIEMRSVPHACSVGTLVDLGRDYRTARTVRACLPNQPTYDFAISTNAYRRHLQAATPREMQSSLEAICTYLGRVTGLTGQLSTADSEFHFPGNLGQAANCWLKLEWYAPNKYWVLLLPEEQLRSGLKLA